MEAKLKEVAQDDKVFIKASPMDSSTVQHVIEVQIHESDN